MPNIAQEEFNDLMKKAIGLKKDYPNAENETIARIVCSQVKEIEIEELFFQVVYNLVNLSR